jgi:hypothetical protein
MRSDLRRTRRAAPDRFGPFVTVKAKVPETSVQKVVDHVEKAHPLKVPYQLARPASVHSVVVSPEPVVSRNGTSRLTMQLKTLMSVPVNGSVLNVPDSAYAIRGFLV